MNAVIERAQVYLSPTKRNFLWMMLANGVYALCQWGILIVLAKLGSAQIVGQFALAAAITAPVIMITNMQLRGVQATDARRDYSLSDYLAVRIISSIVAFAAVLLILGLGHFGRTAFLAIVILTLAKALESYSDLFYGYFQQYEEMGLMARSMMLRGILSVLILGAVFHFSSSLPWALVGLTCAWLMVLISYDAANARRLSRVVEGNSGSMLLKSTSVSLRDRRAVLSRITLLACPLGIVMGIVSLNTNIPRYAVEKYLGAHDLGIFAALAYTAVAVNMFVQALGQAVSPRLARHFADRDIGRFVALVRKMVVVNFLIGVVGVGVIAVGGKWILAIVYTHEYAPHAKLFLLLMVSAMLSGVASALGYAMTAARQFKLQVPLFSLVMVCTGLVSFLCIPMYGLYGAAIALVASALLQIIGAAWITGLAIRSISCGSE